ncbi:MAG: hypothetical protein K0Q79_2060 [Flavipsychrobacter sp.]|nr:hypothetical protein [Flavipsychrobacter sp.]
MTTIILTTIINAPVQRCFDLSRSIDLHMLSSVKTNEKAVAGRTSGLIVAGESVTWEAKHFGVKQYLTVKITDMAYPTYFRDEMVKGAFKSMWHEHHFTAVGERTEMKDVFCFESPLGIFGRIFNTLLLTRYMTRFLAERNEVIKNIAEGSEWRKILE